MGQIFYLFLMCFIFIRIAKSTQFSHHVWLPDAMEGPIPILALIHATIMIAARIFL